jgi:hypothetical protein
LQTFTSIVFLDVVSPPQNRIGYRLFRAGYSWIITFSISVIAQPALVYVQFAANLPAALDLGDLGVILALAGTSFILHERRYERKLNLDLTWAEAGEMTCEWSNFKSCPQSSP